MFRRRPRAPDLPWPPGALLVGGAVRDLLLRAEAKDYDWLAADPAAAAAWLAEETGGTAFLMDEERGFWRVGGGPIEHDVAPIPPEGIEADLARRDFTVNALAMERSGRLIDHVGGERDLRARRLRAVSEANLREDPLRALRAVRLLRCGLFRLDAQTTGWIRSVVADQAAGSLPLPSPERVRDEVTALLESECAAEALLLADSIGLLDLYLPEFTAMRGVEQPGGLHHLNVFEHSVEALRCLLSTFPDADLATRWGTLLHDVGKPVSRTWDEVGQRWSFFGHDRTGGQLARDLLERLRYPHVLRDRVAGLVDRHMQPLPANEKAARRFVHRNRSLLPDLLRVMLADREAARGPRSTPGGRLAYQQAFSLVLAEMDGKRGPPEPLLDGNEIMLHLGLKPGPAVGRAVAFLAESQAVGDATDLEGARRLLEGWAQAQGLQKEP